MGAGNDDFNITGPTYLTVVDWNNEDHKRSVAAALVQGVYILERDRQKERQESQALAPKWWEFFHFKLVHKLVDGKDNSIFGSVFEYEHKNSPAKGCPHYIVAFRGTLLKPKSFIRDLYYDLQVIRNELHETSRLETALEAVKETVATAQSMNVWLAGHSLGAAMALLVGKKMAVDGTHLESYLFNSPFVCAPLEDIFKEPTFRNLLRIGGSVITAGLVLAMKEKLVPSSDPFNALSKWVPNLFVNLSDRCCSEYIEYFGTRRRMEEWGVGGIARLASAHSLAGLMMNAFGKKAVLAAHLIPSARLTTNKSYAPDSIKAHKLQQWWSMDLQLHTQVHRYD